MSSSTFCCCSQCWSVWEWWEGRVSRADPGQVPQSSAQESEARRPWGCCWLRMQETFSPERIQREEQHKKPSNRNSLKSCSDVRCGLAQLPLFSWCTMLRLCQQFTENHATEKRSCHSAWPERGRAAGRVCLGAPVAGVGGGRRWKRQIGLREAEQTTCAWVQKWQHTVLQSGIMKTCRTCRKYLSNTDLRSGWSSMASCSILSILLLNSFISLSFMSFSSKVSVLVFLAERISLVSLEH